MGIQEVENTEDLSSEQLLVRPLAIALTEKTNIETTLYPIECIKIPLGDVNVLDFSLPEEVKRSLVEKAREATRAWLRTRPKPVRRNSL
jgi:hypothetical protein